MLIYFFLFFFYCISNKTEVSFLIDDVSQSLMRDISTFYNNKINIYSPQFYLTERVRINTNFMMGTSQKVIYLNYPFTFSNDNVSNSMKNSNSAGFVILKDQPVGVTSANLITQTNIVPIAYFTLQDIPIGWSLYTPADYYQQEQAVTQISLYNKNIYIGRISGPINQIAGITDNNIYGWLNKTGKCNVVLGNYSGNFNNDQLLSYNTVVGCYSGNLITGSFNSFFGNYLGDRKIINPNYLNQDYYSNNDYSNYNNGFGFGNYNLTHSTGQGLKFVANKQNNVFGNLNFSSIWRGYRNCIFGNRILTTEVDNITQFSWIDSNIIIGNNILYQYNNNLLNGFYGNMIFIPNGDLAVYGGIEVSKAFAPIVNNSGAQCNYTIMIGSCGLPIAYQRSYKTFIANIYNSSLIQTGAPLANTTAGIATLGNLGSTTFPVTVMINNADQLGQMELLPYRNFSIDGYNPTTEPGNVTDLDYVVNFLLDPKAMPVVGVAFENTAAATKNGLLFTIDAYSLIHNASILANNPLASFVIYTAPKAPAPYSVSNSTINTQNVISANTSDPTIAGYEHYYLIPVLVRTCQILNAKINTLSNNFVCGNLIAADQPGQTVMLGNSDGLITLISSKILKPDAGNNILMVNSSGNVVTGDTTVSSFNCANLNASSISTNGFAKIDGDLTCANLTATTITSSGFAKIDNDLTCANLNASSISTNGFAKIDSDLTCGNLAAAGAAGEVVRLGNQSGEVFVFGSAIHNPIGLPMQLYIGVDGALETQSSSVRYKKNIQKCQMCEEDINKLNPVSFQYKNKDAGTHFGFLAEEVYDIKSLQNTVIFNQANEIESIDYNSLFVGVFSFLLEKQKIAKKIHKEWEIKYKKLSAGYLALKKKLKKNNNQIKQLKKEYDDLKKMVALLARYQNNR
jgi:hypothetical protein